jgi:preprotein translocase subunit SecB
MTELKQSPFSFKQFHIDEFSIRREPNDEGEPDYQFEPSGLINEGDRTFLLSIDLTVKDSNGAYNIDCKCFGFFTFNVKEGEDLVVDDFFYLNAPAIMFPYIRAYISSVTALSGLATVNLPLLNFPKIIGQDLRDNTQTINLTEE